LFLGFGYKVNVHFNFRSKQTQAGMQVLPVILFRVSLFHRFIIQKALSQITNIEHIFSAKSVKQRQLPGCPSWLWAWSPFNYFKIASLEFSWYFPYVFSCLVL